MEGLQDLEQWCREQGAEFGGVAGGIVDEGCRGLVATRTIEKGQDAIAVMFCACILSVPTGLLMCVDSARRDPDLRRVLGRHPQLSSQQVLAIHLLHELSKGRASRWRPYLRTLPPTYTTALCFTEAEAEALQVSLAVAAAQAARASAEAQWRGALPALRALALPPKWRSHGAWQWAAAGLSSRTMFLESDAAGALAPVGDLANYQPPPPPFLPHLQRRDRSSGGAAGSSGAGPAGPAGEEVAGTGRLVGDRYCLFAGRSCQPGDQVFLCYGRHSNLELVVFYGFVLAGGKNPHDSAGLPPCLLPPEAAAELAGCSAAECCVCAGGAPSWQLLRALRLGCASREERRRGAHAALADQPIGAAAEARAVGALRQVCRAALGALPTTAGQDEALLAAADQGDPALSPRMRLAVEWRLGYKRLLVSCVAHCDAILAALPESDDSCDFLTWRG